MLAIFWSIKKFDYELKGRKFRLITDNKELENLIKTPTFKNNCINRWVELFQEFYFTIGYQKPANLVGLDASFRIYEEYEQAIFLERGKTMQNWKINKHVSRRTIIHFGSLIVR